MKSIPYIVLEYVIALWMFLRSRSGGGVNVGAEVGSRATRESIVIDGGIGACECRVGCADCRRLVFQAIVKYVLVAHGVIERIGIPNAVDEVLIVGTGCNRHRRR